MTSNFYIKKRQELTDKIENNSLVILHSNYQTFKSADSIHEFHVNNNFYYLKNFSFYICTQKSRGASIVHPAPNTALTAVSQNK